MSAAGKTQRNEMIKLGNFRVGPIKKFDFCVVRYDADKNQQSRLGMDGLDTPKVIFDLKKWKMNFDSAIPSNLVLHDLLLYPKNTFGFKAQLAGKTIEALWDTGAELSVIDRDFVLANPQNFKFIKKIENGTDATGSPVEFELYQTSDLLIGKESISGTVMTMDFQMIKDKVGSKIKLIIGTNLMRDHIWYFDFANHRWTMAK